jgi:myo-inositol-1(or 4)-monophosphatase
LPARDQDRADTALLIEATRAGGDIARKFFGGEYKRWNKGQAGPVTEADYAVDKHLRETLLAARPDYGWLSEETEDDPSRLSRERVFIADPIDGTRAFLRGLPEFTIVACVVAGDRPVAAAIFNPIMDEMYEAIAGGGARRNGSPLRVSDQDGIENCRMIASKEILARQEWGSPWPPMHVENRRSIAYRMALVGAGDFDAMISLGAKHDWDVAAGDLIVHEAGGRVTTGEGDTMRYNTPRALQPDIVAATPLLHERLIARTRELRARDPAQRL